MHQATRAEDLIDFPCSDLWLDHYHAMGLTPRSSEQRRQTAEMAALRREVQGLREILGELVDAVIDRQAQHSAKRPTDHGTETTGQRADPPRRLSAPAEPNDAPPNKRPRPRFTGGVNV